MYRKFSLKGQVGVQSESTCADSKTSFVGSPGVGLTGMRERVASSRHWPRKKYLYHINACRFTCNRDGFHFDDSPIFASALHNFALDEFIDHLILMQLFLALDAVVVVHDVFHISTTLDQSGRYYTLTEKVR